MNPVGKNGDQNKPKVPPEPLCLFCFPEDVSSISSLKTSYVNVLPQREPPPPRFTRRKTVKNEEGQTQGGFASKERVEFWQKKRLEARIIRRRMKEPIRNLKSYLLTSISKNDNAKVLPSLFEVLETVKDAWPPPPERNIFPLRKEYQMQDKVVRPKMKEEVQIQLTSPLPNRRFSMPEELMRKYSITREKSCDESEENKTMVEMSSSTSSSTTEQEDTVRTKKNATSETQTNLKTVRVENLRENVYEEFEKKPKTELPKRVTQNDFYCHGKRFLKLKSVEKSIQVDGCTCRTEKSSSITASVKEETEESATSESIPSSSPFLLPKCESSSDNLSSESDSLRCTCRELTSSKETSTDIFHSGKSTLSQTVTDKSSSTQDTTISVRSVSTRGSSASDGSYSTPERERTSAKETTTTSDYSPRTPKNAMSRKSRKKERHHLENYHQISCPRYYETKHSKSFNCTRHCDSKHVNENTKTCGTNTDVIIGAEEDLVKTDNHKLDIAKTITQQNQTTTEKYKKAKLSSEELYMMQQLRHQKLVERGFIIPLEVEKQENIEPNKRAADIGESVVTTTVKTSTSEKTGFIDQSIMIPRYSALPRTLSMVVNTSSADNNSDSDNLSLVDSLEDQPITHIHNLCYDTKKESKPVRGDANTLLETKQVRRPPKGKAFFVSIKDPYGESEMLNSIQKIPQPPEKIKNQIFERHLSICTKYKQFYKAHKEGKIAERKRKTKNIKNENLEKSTKSKKTSVEEENKKDQKSTKKKQNDDEKSTKQTQKEDEKKEKNKTPFKRKRENKDCKGKFNSKIPVLVSSRSSSSTERERDSSKKSMPKQKGTVVTTQILEITHSNAELGLQKPQAVIHPVESEGSHGKNLIRPLTMPPLIPDLRIPPSLDQPFNKPIFLTPLRRSPVTRFRQRFEVIPEEKSSSLSSTDEKVAPEPKFKDISTSPLLMESSNPKLIEIPTSLSDDMTNFLVTKIKDTHFENLPYVNGGDDQKIILFSSRPQNSNSSKGRDALIAMNREDFTRLAKGWMNFYKLNDNWDNSDDEKMTARRKNKENSKTCSANDVEEENIKNYMTAAVSRSNENSVPNKKQTETELENAKSKREKNNIEIPEWKYLKSPQIDENIRFHSSNTVLRPNKKISPSETSRMILPQLNVPVTGKEKKGHSSKSTVATLPKVSKYLEGDDDGEDTDSDSTDYMEPPSPRVPPLSLGDFPSDGTLSSSDNEFEEKKPQITHHQIKPFHGKKRGVTNRAKPKKENYFPMSRYEKRKNSGWSVTVAGTVELSRSASDLEMRLSFPVNGRPPTMCQSDSGFAEDSNYSKVRESNKDLNNLHTSRRNLPLGSGNMTQKWTVTVKNPNQEESQDHESKPSKNTNHILPNLGPSQSRNSKRTLKEAEMEESLMKEIIERKLYAIWPKVQKAVQREFLSESGRWVTEFQKDLYETCMSVRGTAVVMKKKEKPLSMTEKDLTKRYSSRKNTEHLENGQEIDK